MSAGQRGEKRDNWQAVVQQGHANVVPLAFPRGAHHSDRLESLSYSIGAGMILPPIEERCPQAEGEKRDN